LNILQLVPAIIGEFKLGSTAQSVFGAGINTLGAIETAIQVKEGLENFLRTGLFNLNRLRRTVPHAHFAANAQVGIKPDLSPEILGYYGPFVRIPDRNRRFERGFKDLRQHSPRIFHFRKTTLSQEYLSTTVS
jgi:hypothetical protein